MKKYAILALVLGLTSFAGAALTTTIIVNGGGFDMATDVAQWGDTVTVNVGNDTPSAGGTTDLQMMVSDGINGTIALLGTWMLPGTGSSVIDNGDGSLTFDWADGTIGLNVTGDWVTASFDIPVNVMEITISFSGTMFGETPPGSPTTLTAPEPVTIALLGIGGLLMRRRW